MIEVRTQIPVITLVFFLTATAAMASGDANLVIGQKALNDDLFDEAGVDGQSQWGVAVSLDFQWPVMLAVDLLSSSDDHRIVVAAQNPLEYWTDVETTELNVGVRKYWGKNVRPYVGGGLAYVQLESIQIFSGSFGPGTEFADIIVDDDDSALGLWLNAGLLYRLSRSLNVGFDLRHSDADAKLLPNGVDTHLKLDSGGLHYGIIFGYHW